MFFRLVKQTAEGEGVTKKLKASNQMAWVARMNDIRNRVTEIVTADLIYAQTERRQGEIFPSACFYIGRKSYIYVI